MSQKLNRVTEIVSDRMTNAMKVLSERQDAPIGQRPRSNQEQAAIFTWLKGLKRPERQAVMESLADASGHQDDEKEMCELCAFLAKRVKV